VVENEDFMKFSRLLFAIPMVFAFKGILKLFFFEKGIHVFIIARSHSFGEYFFQPKRRKLLAKFVKIISVGKSRKYLIKTLSAFFIL
jgi:hypothetical protein